MNSRRTVGKARLSTNDRFGTYESAGSIIKDIPRPKSASFIRRLEVEPSEQERIPLGNFTDNSEPKGFLVEIDPDPSPADSVVTKVTSLVGGADRYSLHLHIANFGLRKITAEVWQL